MFSVTKTFKFESAHRLLGHQGKCRHLHGHSYTVIVSFSSSELNSLGMVMDFQLIKDTVGNWISDNWDHNAILNIEDPLALQLHSHNGSKVPYKMYCNPTAENLAKELFDRFDLFNSPVRISQVTIYETETSCASYSGEERENSSKPPASRETTSSISRNSRSDGQAVVDNPR
jgi:6-pyruvoyltetrahydropterin/6-carboxytetrahydropterin synthase